MEKDKRYNTIKILIDNGHITRLGQVFEHVPVSKVATDLGTNYNRLKRLVEHVDQFVIRDLYMLGNFLGIERKKILELLDAQYAADKNNKKK